MISHHRSRPLLSPAKLLTISGSLLLVLSGCAADGGGTAGGSATGVPTDETQTAMPEATGSDAPEPTASATESASADSQLTIVLTAGDGAEPVTYELACAAGEPVGETGLPDPAAACEVLALNGDLMMAEPETGAMCTQMYGGPETAVVTGTVDGEEVDTTFSRENGCAIDRWTMFEPLLGTPGGVQ